MALDFSTTVLLNRSAMRHHSGIHWLDVHSAEYPTKYFIPFHESDEIESHT